jgi:quercetin dioxygenase-like cupin family protein
MQELIRVGEMSITFLKSRHETGGVLDLFEMTIPPHGHLIVPHLHRDYDESIIGMNGILTWTVDGRQTQLRRGQHLFIPRGVVHDFTNHHRSTARMMCILTPGMVGPEYFLELADVFNVSGPPNLAKLGAVMTRYGVVPVATA